MVPEGLLGFAMAMIFVRGCNRSHEPIEGKLQILARQHRDDLRIGRRRIHFVHGVSGHGQKQFVAGIEKGFKEHVDGFIYAVCQCHLRGAATTRCAATIASTGSRSGYRVRSPAEMRLKTSRTSGEHAIVFSLKSSRIASRLPSGG